MLAFGFVECVANYLLSPEQSTPGVGALIQCSAADQKPIYIHAWAIVVNFMLHFQRVLGLCARMLFRCVVCQPDVLLTVLSTCEISPNFITLEFRRALQRPQLPPCHTLMALNVGPLPGAAIGSSCPVQLSHFHMTVGIRISFFFRCCRQAKT